ncbi:MAG: hypothetical protein M5U23_02775 [Acidimicrobiia bacterium]|nr:hypothetical protein [Acidimicrobiia bacterium]
MRKKLLIFGLLALILTACRLESNVALDIAEDGSAVFTFEIGMDDEFRELVTSDLGTTEDNFLDELFTDIDGTGPMDTRTEGDMTYYSVSSDIEDLTTWDGGGGDTGFSSFSYTFDDKGARLTAHSEGEDSSDLGGDFGFDPSQITGDFISATVTIKMPGEVTEHNADETSGGNLIWHIPLGGSVDILAVSSFGTSSSTWIWIVLGGILIVGLIAAIVVFTFARKDSEKAVAAAAEAHEATPPSPPPSSTPTDTIEVKLEPADTDTPEPDDR